MYNNYTPSKVYTLTFTENDKNKNGLKYWKCMESILFSIDTPPPKRWYTGLNVDIYGWILSNLINNLNDNYTSNGQSNL